MFWKIAFGALAILGILWAAGCDFQGAKDALVGASQDNAESLTGTGGDDWAD